MSGSWSEADLRWLGERGISREEADRQLDLLRDPPPPARLVRAATVGDGIAALAADDDPARLEACDEALADGRLTRFVPASGAATRMFRDLLEEIDDPASTGESIRRFVGALDDLPFDPLVRAAESRCEVDVAAARASGDAARRLVAELLHGDEVAPGLADLPKGLLPFHRISHGGDVAHRTPSEEHVSETRELAGTRAGLHFTVAPEHEERFVAVLRAFDPEIPVGFSHQQPSTDTLALTEDGSPLRDEDGNLALRPGGHGALIGNLERAPSDLVAIRNVDNVLPARRRAERQLWNRRLIGDLILFERRVHRAIESLARRGDASAARAVAAELCIEAPSDDDLIAALDRPLRVCGMVENLGEPGGGPFWVRTGTGTALQIVESSQIDDRDAGQAEIAAGATHFNPADLVCSLRRWDGGRFALADLVDPATSFVADKSHLGQPIRALERPGLWNGAMAGWLTRFVEIPASTFAPVKTVWDLLRPEHQPASDEHPAE